ncbi:Coenzyme F420-reducing hydrogenase, delta subunit [Candidatus Methanophagaceae archaeon]|nr:Coenzyme F420-reducing hydrogenase, delta subunit [Methanophagales archaeon]
MLSTFEPKILSFCCSWCSYVGADLACVSYLVEKDPSIDGKLARFERLFTERGRDKPLRIPCNCLWQQKNKLPVNVTLKALHFYKCLFILVYSILHKKAG